MLQIVRGSRGRSPHQLKELAARSTCMCLVMECCSRLVRAAGAVVMVPGTDGDGRKLFHAIPPGCLRDGANGREIDCGMCVLRLG